MEENKAIRMMDEEDLKRNAKIKVIGVGGGGGNAVNGMLHDKEELVEYWVCNTDCQALSHSACDNKLVLGRDLTKGLGAGGDPACGKAAAESSYEDIKRIVEGADMVFIAAGEGGGTGTGAAPVVAKAAKEAGCLVIGIVTRPFNFEGKQRRTNALEGINNLKDNVDAIIVISNDKLSFNDGGRSFASAFHNADEILSSSVKTVTDLILKPGIINLDFADVKNTLKGKGLALIGIGYGKGEKKTIDAATAAINSPLLEASIRGSHSMIINFTIGPDTTLNEAEDAVNFITEAAVGKENEDCNIIFGIQEDPDFKDEVKIAIIATDFNKDIDNTVVSVLPKAEEKKQVETNQEELKAHLTETEKRIEEERNTSVLPGFLRRKMQEPKAEEAPQVKEENEAVPAEEEDEEPTVIIDRPEHIE